MRYAQHSSGNPKGWSLVGVDTCLVAPLQKEGWGCIRFTGRTDGGL